MRIENNRAWWLCARSWRAWKSAWRTFLSVNNFYGTKHHCASRICLACYPAKIYQTRPSNLTPKRALPIMIIEPTCMVEVMGVAMLWWALRTHTNVPSRFVCEWQLRGDPLPKLKEKLIGFSTLYFDVRLGTHFCWTPTEKKNISRHLYAYPKKYI